MNPDHNGGKYDYQKQEGGGRPGKTDTALLNKLIDPSVLWFSWAYGCDLYMHRSVTYHHSNSLT